MSGLVMHSSTTSLRSNYINACILVCDVTNYRSLEWLKVILNTHPIATWTYALLVCNKVDLVDEDCGGHPDKRDIFVEDLDELCEQYGLDAAVEVSALTSLRVHEALADAVMKGDQLKWQGPPKPKGLTLGLSRELDWGYQHRTINLFPMCVPNRDEA